MSTIGVNGRQSLMEFRQGDSNTATYSNLSGSLIQSHKVLQLTMVYYIALQTTEMSIFVYSSMIVWNS